MPYLDIRVAEAADLEPILALQRLAYAQEAALYGEPDVATLTRSLAELEDELERGTRVLKVVAEERIVGAARVRLLGSVCRVEGLAVHPERQRQGIGSTLLRAVEARFADRARRFEISTGERSAGSLRLCRRHGYEPVRRERLSPRLTLVYLEKPNRP